MKYNFKFKVVALAVVMIFASCSSDDNSSNENAQEAESTALAANNIADNVVILGGTQKEDEFPTPNEAITFDISSSSKTAFLSEGFEVVINSEDNITGALLQFKSNDGLVSDSYYDIDLEVNNPEETEKKKKVAVFKSKNSITAKTEYDVILDVDFNDTIESGEFCYVIWVYDADGNISAPEEWCVTVENWGANDAAAGDWNYIKDQMTYDGDTTEILAGVADCGEYVLDCENGNEIVVSSCFTIENFTLEINSDGTYRLETNETTDDFDTIATEETCTDTRIVYPSRYQSEGKWAYVDAEDRLVFLEYSFIEEEDGVELYVGTNEPGDADIIFEGQAEISNDALTITQDYGDGEIGKYFFEK